MTAPMKQKLGEEYKRLCQKDNMNGGVGHLSSHTILSSHSNTNPKPKSETISPKM